MNNPSMNTGLLSQLAPAHASPPPGWWPLAPGWWVLVVLLLGLAAGRLWWTRRLSYRQRKAALGELRRLEQSPVDEAELARAVEDLLRRYAVARFGRQPVARLSGAPWIEFVAAHGGSALAGEAGRELLRAAYGGQASSSHAHHRELWLNGARCFIRSAA